MKRKNGTLVAVITILSLVSGVSLNAASQKAVLYAKNFDKSPKAAITKMTDLIDQNKNNSNKLTKLRAFLVEAKGLATTGLGKNLIQSSINHIDQVDQANKDDSSYDLSDDFDLSE